MDILRFSLGQLEANCYFLINDDECLIIDPADESSFILEELQRRKLKLVGMLATHGHFDHIMAAGEIQISVVETSRRDVSTLYMHKNDRFLVKRLNETAKYFLGYAIVIIKPISIKHLIEIKNKIGQFRFEVIHSPGHTPGSCCYYFPSSYFANAMKVKKASRDRGKGIIFTGDTLFKQGIGRYDFSYSNKNDLKKAIVKLLELPDDTIVYPGHGEKTTIGEEKDFVRNII